MYNVLRWFLKALFVFFVIIVIVAISGAIVAFGMANTIPGSG